MTTKKLVQSNVLAMEANNFQRKQITVTANGEEFIVSIDTKFKDTEIAKIFSELIKRSEHAKKASLDFDVSAYILILLIKHFTDIDFQETNSMSVDMDIEIRTLNALINLGIFEQIIENFDKKEIEKFNDMLAKNETGLKHMANNIMATEVAKRAKV